MGLYHSPRIVTDGLVLCLDAANIKSYPGSGTIWYDLSGNNRNGTLVDNPQFSSGNRSNFLFNGSYTTVPISISSSTITFEMIFSPVSPTVWTDFAVLDNGTNELMIEYGGVNQDLRYYSNFGSFNSNNLASASQILVNGNIYVAHLTIGNGTITSYFNGLLQGSSSWTEASVTFTRLVIGNDLLRTGRYTNSKIYSIKLYNRALTSTEVLQNFNALRGRFGI